MGCIASQSSPARNGNTGRVSIKDAKIFHNAGRWVDIESCVFGSKRSVASPGDIDALPTQEAREDLLYRSQVNGFMRACGHSSHGPIALGAALAFHRLPDNFGGRGGGAGRLPHRGKEEVAG